jgi:hypothetical protein
MKWVGHNYFSTIETVVNDRRMVVSNSDDIE